MSSKSAASSAIVRTGVKAGATFVVSLAKSVVFAVVLCGAVFGYYLLRVHDAGVLNHRGEAGFTGLLAFLGSPPIVVGLLLICFLPLYVTLGVARARSRAVERVAALHGNAIAERLGGLVAQRIEAMPRAHKTLHVAADWLDADMLSRQIAPLVGDSAPVRAMIAQALERLPLPEIFAQWQQMRAEAATTDAPRLADDTAHHPAPETSGAVRPPQDPVLRALLAERIGDILQDMAASSRTLFWWALGAHAVVLGIGIWVTRVPAAAAQSGTPMW